MRKKKGFRGWPHKNQVVCFGGARLSQVRKTRGKSRFFWSTVDFSRKRVLSRMHIFGICCASQARLNCRLCICNRYESVVLSRHLRLTPQNPIFLQHLGVFLFFLEVPKCGMLMWHSALAPDGCLSGR